jgi:3'-phosphoadenosine 5'-phosphosulfate (PAPS) 3'-phosphatase
MAVFLDRPAIWDIAAGAAILSAAGGTLRYLEGKEVLTGGMLEEGPCLKPMLGAHPSIIDRLRAHIKPRPSA